MASVNTNAPPHGRDASGQQSHQGVIPKASANGALLTQTIVHSPTVKWILPARLRSSEHNDVVFVGAQTVQVKEALLEGPGMEGRLLDITQKTDFPGPITAAKVLNVTEELPLGSARLDSTWGGPAQILVLSVDMKELQFVYISPKNRNEFVTVRKELPRGVSLDMRFGKDLAVDPKSRAIAVSAVEEYFGILWLKAPSEAQNAIENGTFNPIQKEKFYKTHGTILFLEFLYPQDANDKSITLLLILYRNEDTYASTYKWDQDDMRHPTTYEFKLRQNHRMPTMIVPLTKKASFLVASTQEMTVYSPNNSPRPRNYPFLGPAYEITAACIWTRWARPARNWLYSQRHDGIYLCREDGWVYLLEFGNEGDLESQVSLGQIHCDVDMAFDVLDMGHEGGDFILAAGSTGDAGLFVQEARASPRRVQQSLNWAPIKDATMSHTQSWITSQGGVARYRYFACSESPAGGGAIHEFRWGIEAPLKAQLQIDNFRGIRDMWLMKDEMAESIYILISDPGSTLILQTDFGLESITALDLEQNDLSSDPTVAAGFVQKGVLVQVTEQATHLFCPQDGRKSWKSSDQTTISAAHVHESSSIIATVCHGGDCLYSLHVNEVMAERDSDEISLSEIDCVQLLKEPICVTLEKFGEKVFAFLGNSDGTITVFVVQSDTPVELFETPIKLKNDKDFSTVVESLAVVQVKVELEKDKHTLRAFLLCGLRSGFLAPFEIDFNGTHLIDLQRKKMTRLGTTSARLRSMGSFAMAICGGDLWHAGYNPDLIPAECFVRRVWITDEENPASFPTDIFGVGIMSPSLSLGSLFCVTHSELLLCQMGQYFKIVPRRIELPGKPGKLTYSDTLKCLIASYDTLEVEDMEQPLQRSLRSHLKFIDPDSQNAIVHDESQSHWTPTSARGETITCILDWPCEKGEKKYHFVAIGTRMPRLSASREYVEIRGRVIILYPRRDSTEPFKFTIKTKYIEEFGCQIHALANHGTSLIVAYGSRLAYVPLRGVASPASLDLPSPGISLTVFGNDVFVTTARHSWMIYYLKIGTYGISEWILRKYDTITRNGLTHVVQPPPRGDHLLLFMSFLGGRVEIETIQANGKLQATPWGIGPTQFREVSLHHPRKTLYTNLAESLLRFFPQVDPGAPYYGITMQGTIIRFSLPKKSDLPLLKFLQNICFKDESIFPSLRRWERQRQSLRDMSRENIDGDLLARLAARGPQYFERLLASLASADRYNGAEELFNQLAPPVVGNASPEAVIGWLREILIVRL